MRNPFETEERAAFRETVRRFVETEVKPFADDWDEAGEVPWELHEKVGALGAFGFGVSEKDNIAEMFTKYEKAHEMNLIDATFRLSRIAGPRSNEPLAGGSRYIHVQCCGYRIKVLFRSQGLERLAGKQAA